MSPGFEIFRKMRGHFPRTSVLGDMAASRTFETEFTVCRPEGDLEVVLSAEIEPYYKGNDECPPEEGGVRIQDVTIDGKSVELTPEEMVEAEKAVLEEIRRRDEDAVIDAAEARMNEVDEDREVEWEARR